MAREPDSFNVSTWPRRTTVENSVPSRTTASAAVAPVFTARETTSAASSRRLASTSLRVSGCVAMLPGRAADGHAIQLQCRNAHAHRHRLAVFAAGAYTFVELQVRSEFPDVWPCYLAVPPTVVLSSFSVGMPTPTGTDWPSLPQVPTPSSSCRSLPTIETLVSASAPLPIKVQFLSGPVISPFSIMYA